MALGGGGGVGAAKGKVEEGGVVEWGGGRTKSSRNLSVSPRMPFERVWKSREGEEVL